ncbi:MAG TPA: carbamoyltransferase HypF [Solirubrobacteraceae bacterium]|nr:carbamoyltransferase HypF [Solirubrobacteraceae bacterium]
MSWSADPVGSPVVAVAVAVAPDRRVRARVIGTVQGVGFRPYVYRLAGELGLAGWVLNDAHGVLVEVEGPGEAVETFLARLAPEAPPLATVEGVVRRALAPLGECGFVIRPSPLGECADAPVAPDAATCAECLAELADPGDRRHRYPFINCTNCGPRFSIVRAVPYDRQFTTMAAFSMCPECRAEYEDPADRRFHAQPNACPVCGPAARLVWLDGRAERDHPDGSDPVRAAAEALRAGRILGVKGIGGFHLACRADDGTAVSMLRARKHREDRPFALMVASVADAAGLVELDDAAAAALSGPQRPIVLARRRAGAAVSDAVAPRLGELGVMLAYSPLHHLLLTDIGSALVMTSANVSDEPIAYRDADALARLAGIADGVLTHDRRIETRTDDSVLRIVDLAAAPRPMLVRRSRGYVPASLPLPCDASRPILACGAELKSTFCVARGARAWLSHHIGDLANADTLRSFTDGIEHFQRLFAVRPQVVAHDLHPEYLSTKYAVDLADAVEARGEPPLELIGVQHHHAHLTACLAEHGETGPALGAIFDGTGDGGDGTVWGGELLLGDLAGFRRVGALAQVRMPGGEQAIREPWRMACAWLTAAGVERAPVALAGRVDPRRWELVADLARSGLASPMTTSMGRLLDAAAALCGLPGEVSYEGQAAIEFEALCDPGERGAYEMVVGGRGDLLCLDPFPALAALISDVRNGVPAGIIAARFHAAVAQATVRACVALAAVAHTELVVLAGGVFLNRRLLEATAAGLHAAGLRVLVPRRLPPGDGAIAYGQAAIAAWRGEAGGR